MFVFQYKIQRKRFNLSYPAMQLQCTLDAIFAITLSYHKISSFLHISCNFPSDCAGMCQSPAAVHGNEVKKWSKLVSKAAVAPKCHYVCHHRITFAPVVF